MTLAVALKIENFQDILDVFDREPELLRATRNYLLSRELQAIPDTVAELTSVVKELAANAQASNARLDRLEAIVAQLAADHAELKAIVGQLAEAVRANTGRLDRLEAAVARLEAIVAQLAADHAELKAIVGQLATDQAELKFTVAQLVVSVQANTNLLTRIAGRVDSISGDRYQRFVARIGHRPMRREFSISDLTIIHTDWAQSDIIKDIAAAKQIADYEAYDATSIDFIAAGHNESGEPVYAAGEISITLQPDDIYKTARRAGVIAKALAAATFPVAIGQHIPDDTAAAAVEHAVTVIAIEPPE